MIYQIKTDAGLLTLVPKSAQPKLKAGYVLAYRDKKNGGILVVKAFKLNQLPTIPKKVLIQFGYETDISEMLKNIEEIADENLVVLHKFPEFNSISEERLIEIFNQLRNR
jgi:hypothetical protein